MPSRCCYSAITSTRKPTARSLGIPTLRFTRAHRFWQCPTRHPSRGSSTIRIHRRARSRCTIFDSKVLGDTRIIRVYTPPDYRPAGKPYPVMVLLDGGSRISPMDTPTVLDNLITAKRIPPLLAVLVSNPSDEGRYRELGGGPAFPDFLTTELMPWVRKEYHATAEPHQTMIAGTSLSGFAAVYAALLHPETFGNVISQSGTLFFFAARQSWKRHEDRSQVRSKLARTAVHSEPVAADSLLYRSRQHGAVPLR